MAAIRSEDREEYLRKIKERDERRRKSAPPPAAAYDPVLLHKALYDRFTTLFMLDGKEVEMMVQPEKSKEEINGYPALFSIQINGSHYGWLVYRNWQWQWFSDEKSTEIAGKIGYVIQAWYQ